MSNSNAIETIMGAVVLAVAGGFLYFAYSQGNVKKVDGYAVSADFSNITGIDIGSDVRIGGIKIGAVEMLQLDPKTFAAVATLRIQDNVKLPEDSSAAIQSAGLLGDKFVTIEPGGADAELAEGGKISFTQSSVSIEEMIGKFVFSGGGADSEAAEKPAAKPAAAADEEASPLSSGLE